MNLAFESPLKHEPGTIASILEACYTHLLATGSEVWQSELEEWKRFDQEVYQNTATIGACVFLSVAKTEIVGFGSWDPRQIPRLGIIGHNCIIPEYRGYGYGSMQMREIVRRLRRLGASNARVLTMDHPFFIPAQRNYLACGFREIRRMLWHRDPKQRVIEYERNLEGESDV